MPEEDQAHESMADMPTFKRQSYKKGSKRRYVHLQPAMHGPASELACSVRARCLGGLAWPMDPFYGTVVAEAQTVPAAPRIPFAESSLPHLAHLASNTALGVARLYDLFAVQHGRVSKKQFELRLNQIAEKTKAVDTGKMVWAIRPEYRKLLATPATEAAAEGAELALHVGDVAMAD